MQTTTTTTSRNLEIEGMSGDTCVQKVKDALARVKDVKTQSVKVGAATIEADDAGCTAACEAIKGAGYKARERSGAHDSGGASRTKPEFGRKEGDQSSSSGRNQGDQSSASGKSQPADGTHSGKPAPSRN